MVDLVQLKTLHAYIDEQQQYARYEYLSEYSNDDIDLLIAMHYAVGYRNKRDSGYRSDTTSLIGLGGILHGDKPRPVTIPSNNSKLRTSSIAYLKTWIESVENIGGNVYMTCNPLNPTYRDADGIMHYRRYSKDCVSRIHNCIIESDTASLEQQYDMLQCLLPWTSCAMYTGNKSIHIWINLGGLHPNTKQYDDTIQYLSYWLSDINHYDYDTRCLTDISRISRIPNVRHSSTKIKSKLLYLNPNAQIFNTYRQFYVKNQNNYINTDNTDSVQFDDKTTLNGNPIASNSDTIVSKPNDPTSTKDTVQKQNNYINTDNTDSVQFDDKNGILISKSPTFINLLNAYYEAKNNGFKQIGTRTTYHYILLRLRRIMNWTDDELISEYTSILDKSQDKYRCTYQQAIADFKKQIKSSKIKGNLCLPCLTDMSLPLDAKHRLDSFFKDNINKKQYRRITKIIMHLWQYIVKLPSKCLDGTLGVKMVEIRETIGWTYYRDIMSLLEQHNLVVKTEPHINSIKTARYKINIHLILWILYYDRGEQLNWITT